MSNEAVLWSKKAMKCYHCGNKTIMQLIAKYTKKDHEEVWADYFSEEPLHVVDWFKHWDLYLCPVCDDVTLFKTSGDSESTHPNGMPVSFEEMLYPSNSLDDSYIPEPIANAFEAALKVRNLDGAICVLALRRALEKMCKHENAKGNDLFTKLKVLQERGALPPIMDKISFILRKEGNSAAHADDVEFDKHTVSQLIDFTQIILDYMYNLPAKIMNAQNRIAKISELEKENNEDPQTEETGAEIGAAKEVK